jgi:hypothetical protein
MKKNKALIIILIILAIYGVIMWFTFKNNSSNANDNNKNNINTKDTNHYYLTLNNISNWDYYQGNWSKIDTSKIEDSNSYLSAYVNNNYLGDYKLKYGTIWNLFDANDNYVNYNGDLIAFSSNFNVILRSLKSVTLSAEEKTFITNNYNTTNYDYLINNQVINLDLDNNGVNDQIICLSSMDENTNLKKNFYNLVIINLNGTWGTLINVNGQDTDDILKSPIYEITNIMNINNIPSIIIKYTYGYISESPEIGNIMYQLTNSQFKQIISD